MPGNRAAESIGFKQKVRSINPAPVGSTQHSNVKDLVGRTFGELVVIRDSATRNNRRAVLWECSCSCGAQVLRDGSTLLSGKSLSCGHRKFTPEVIEKRSRAMRRLETPWRRAYQSYGYAAATRGLQFSISFEDFKKITARDCYYCGCPPMMLKRGRYDDFCVVNGVDRADNNIGYLLGNCVSCCTRCNVMKLHSSHDDFLQHIQKIADYQARGRVAKFLA